MPENEPEIERAPVVVPLRPVHTAPQARHDIRIRYTATEWQALVEAARACHKTGPAFVREMSLAAISGEQSAPEKAPLILELGRCGTALAKLAATAKATGALPEATRLEGALAELLAAVRRLDQPRGRRPATP